MRSYRIRDAVNRLRWKTSRICIVKGCDGNAPGTHPMCRHHARQIDRDTYLRLRFAATDDLVTESLAKVDRDR